MLMRDQLAHQEVTPPRAIVPPCPAAPDDKRPLRDRSESRAGLERALHAGIERLNNVERVLATEPQHLRDLGRELSEARGALHGTIEEAEGSLIPDLASDLSRAAADATPDAEVLRAAIERAARGADPSRVLELSLATGDLAEIEGAYLWPRVREVWRERHASLIATKRTLTEAGADDPQAVTMLRAAVDEHLGVVSHLGHENPWAPPLPDEAELARFIDGMHAIDALVVSYLQRVGREGSPLRAVGAQAAQEIRQKARERWSAWATTSRRAEAGDRPWDRWRNRALFPTILARVLWRGELESRIARERAKPPGTIYAVFRSITRVSASQLQLGLDDQGRQAIVRRSPREGLTVVANVPALSEETFTSGLKLLGSLYTLPAVEWLVARAHAQALDGVDRPDVIEIDGGWETFAKAVLEKPEVYPRERSSLRSLARMLAGTPIRWQDGARSSSLFMLFEDASAAGRGRGRSVIRFTLDARLLEHEHHRARERFGVGAGPAQWAHWRIVPLPRPRILPPLAGTPHYTYGPQALVLRLLWLFFTRHGDQLLDEPRLIQVACHDRRAIADEAHLPARLIDPLLAHFVQHRAVVGGSDSRFAPADPAARAFIANGWLRSRLASETGRRASRAKAAGIHHR